MQIMSIISPEPGSRGTAKTDTAAPGQLGESAEADAGFMAVLAEALAAWNGHSGSEDEAGDEAVPLEMLDGDEEDPAATLAAITDELVAASLPSAVVDEAEGDTEIQSLEFATPGRDGAVAEAEDTNGADAGVSGLAETETAEFDELAEVDQSGADHEAGPPSSSETSVIEVSGSDVEPVDDDPAADRRSSAAGEVRDAGDAESLPAGVTGTEPGRRLFETDTAGRSATRVVTDGSVSPNPASDTEAPAPSRGPTSIAEAMFDAELAAQEADEDPWLQVARVVRPLRQLADGTHRIALQLRPAEMGTVHLEVALEDGRLSMRAVTETVAARDAFAGSLPELRAELSRSGIDLGSLDVGDQTMDGGGGHATERASTGDGDPSQATATTDSRSAVGAAHTSPSGSRSGPGAGRLDLTL